ncbi:hypothetical protein [Pseudonocardia sp. HH130630-07]|uniref:hypothetical protein n=1 Tax=Pseudonocardia sp. HH130630-07 TaxID=1690815 RepID=UPI000814E603|nr:hypothetical protein [Pseudonocardia sp. HH130630-07]ANY09307.1 hypothetical protein AFB00_27110 [Pseudonocardia sp. HH130630-07]
MRGRRGRPRLVVVTALAPDRRVLRQWELTLDRGRRVPLPDGTGAVHINDPAIDDRVRVEPGARARGSGRRPERLWVVLLRRRTRPRP